MSRKDTIIIALLINTGLLALLFMLAINTDEEKMETDPSISLSSMNVVQPSPVVQSPAKSLIAEVQMIDEVDSFLKELTPEERGQAILVDDEGYIELEREPVITHTKLSQVADVKVEETSSIGDVKYVEVTVKRGDALEKIARSNGTTVEAIKKLNNLTGVKLSIGQVLRVPVGKKPSQSTDTATTTTKSASVATVNTSSKDVEKKPTNNSEPKYYTIKSGDNPWKIARQFQVKFEDLLVLNNLDEEKARNLKVGDKIRVQ